jgi:hypothetical protein
MDAEGDHASGHERQERERQQRAAEQRQQDFAAEPSHREADGAIELGKTACQALLLVNGGAVTALLAYASQHPASALTAPLTLISIGLFSVSLVSAFMAALKFQMLAREAALRREFLANRGDKMGSRTQRTIESASASGDQQKASGESPP